MKTQFSLANIIFNFYLKKINISYFVLRLNSKIFILNKYQIYLPFFILKFFRYLPSQMNVSTKQISSVITQDPLNVFRFENEWNVGIFDCCEDCRLSTFLFQLIIKIFLKTF